VVRARHHRDDVASDDRPLQNLALDHSGRVGAELDTRLLRGREHETVGLLGLGLPNLDAFADADVGVLAREAVDADGVRVPVLPVGTPHLRGSGFGTLDLDDVTRAELQVQERVGVEAGDTRPESLG